MGLTLIGLSFTALTAIWPADNLDVVEAKLALAESTGPYGDDQDGDYVPALAPATATRNRAEAQGRLGASEAWRRTRCAPATTAHAA